ncbi:Hypothetical predicted protein [Olea europaea subsp. europaea]|uniref:Uncharacterized protein n=1 Tax=Olea europaea subsp. europaea TaxID=158383 RepID=A0A8S0SK77_OLEEU|nr:Hypothetical predicted protein [Olea europaea subsp. europaea]
MPNSTATTVTSNQHHPVTTANTNINKIDAIRSTATTKHTEKTHHRCLNHTIAASRSTTNTVAAKNTNITTPQHPHSTNKIGFHKHRTHITCHQHKLASTHTALTNQLLHTSAHRATIASPLTSWSYSAATMT